MSGPTGVDDQDKLRNLWKQSRGVVDIHKENLYNNTSERPFVKQTLNKEIFSDDVPDSLGAVPPTWSGAPRQDQPDYSVENLDASFNAIYYNSGFTNSTYAPGTTHSLAPIGYPHLTYYHQWEFKEFDTADQLSRPNGDVVATTWYIEDLSNNVTGRQKSLARNTISFNKGGRGDYQQKFYIRDQNPRPNNLVDVTELEDPYKFVFDNQSGFILLYANDALSSNWYLNSGASGNPVPITEGPLVGSFIRYTGAKGASSGSGGGGGGSSGSVGNINLVQVLELENENLKYHPPFEDIGLGGFVPPKGKYYMPIANYVIASVDKTSALAMGYFTVKIRGPNYDLVFQFIASVVNGRNPTIKVLNSNLESQIDGWGNVIMYDDDANNKWRICLGFDETEKIPVGTPNAPWTNVNPAGAPAPSWWINGGQSQQTIEYIRITLVNNNANQNNLTINPIADGNWELSSENDFKDVTLAPIHSITGIWGGQPTNLPIVGAPPSINYTYRYKVISKLALSNIDPSGNIASDTAVNVFYKDIALAHNTKIGSWKFDTNATNENHLVNGSGPGSGFWENVRTYESKYNKGDLTLEGEKIKMDSKLLNIIGDITTDGKITINGDIEHSTSTVIKEVNYDNNNFTTRTGTTGTAGTWQTIARTETLLDVHLRRATAIFEVFDKSNTINNTAGVDPNTGANGERDLASVDDYILFSVSWQYDTYTGQNGFHNIDPNTGMIDPPRCTINVINSRCGVNSSSAGSMGYISSLRVETNFIKDSTNGNHQAVAQIQIKRHSSGTLAGNPIAFGVTDVKVRMLNDNKGINSNTLNWNLVSNSFFFTVSSSQNGSHILEFPLCKYDTTTGNLTDNNRTGVVSSSVVNGDLQSTYFDKLKADYLQLSGNLDLEGDLDMNNGSILNVKEISKGSTSDKPRIEFDGNKVNINLDDSQNDSQLVVGNANSNNCIKIKCGAVSVLDMNDFNIENADKILSFNATGSLQNRAYVQEIEYNLSSLMPANNSWISIGFLGKFDLSGTIIEDNMRGDALVELENRNGNYHHTVKFRIQYSYGNPNIRVISNNWMTYPKFKELRLAYRFLWPGIYTGCVLQFKLDSSQNTSSPGVIYMKIWQNSPEGTSSGGWKFDTTLFQNTAFSMPTIYVPDALHGKTNSSDPPPYFGTSYPNEVSVSLETNGELQQTNKLGLKDDLDLSGILTMEGGGIVDAGNILADKIDNNNSSNHLKIGEDCKGVEIYGDANTNTGLLARASSSGVPSLNKNAFTINPNGEEHSTFNIKMTTSNYSTNTNKRVVTALLSESRLIELNVPLRLETTSRNTLDGTNNTSTAGPFTNTPAGQGAPSGVELAASWEIGKNTSASQSLFNGQLPAIRVREPYKSGNLAVDNNYILTSEYCYNLITKDGLTQQLMNLGSLTSVLVNGKRRFRGNTSGNASSSATTVHSVGLFQSFKGEDLGGSGANNVWQTYFRGRSYFTGCSFSWPAGGAEVLKVAGRAVFALLVNDEIVVEWKSKTGAAGGAAETYPLHKCVVDLPSEDWVYCGYALTTQSKYPKNVYDGVGIFSPFQSMVEFAVIFPSGATSSSDYVELPNPGTYSGNSTKKSLIRMNAYFASLPKL